MYNEAQKQAFVEAHNNNTVKLMLRNTFGAAERYELEAGKDFSLFDKEAVCAALGGMLNSSIDHAFRYYRYLRSYCRWCYEHGYTPVDNMRDMAFDEIDFYPAIKRTMVADPSMLQEKLEQVIPYPMQDDTVFNMYRAAIWLMFSGFKLEEALGIELRDFDYANRVIIYNGERYHLSRPAVQCLKYVANMDEIIANRYGKDARLKLRNTGKLIRSFRGEMKPDNVRNKIYNMNDDTHDFIIQPRMILLSGLFYNLYTRGFNDSETAFINVANIVRVGRIREDKLYDRAAAAGQYQHLYRLWKEVFKLE